MRAEVASHIRLLRTNFVFLVYTLARPPSSPPTDLHPLRTSTFIRPPVRPSVRPSSPTPLSESHQRNYQPRKRGECNAMIRHSFLPSFLPSIRHSHRCSPTSRPIFISVVKFQLRRGGGGDTVGHEFAPLNPRNEFALSIFIRPSAFKFRLVTLTPISFPIYKKLDTTTRPSLNFDNWSQMKAAGFRLPIVFRYSQERARVQGPLGKRPAPSPPRSIRFSSYTKNMV